MDKGPSGLRWTHERYDQAMIGQDHSTLTDQVVVLLSLVLVVLQMVVLLVGEVDSRHLAQCVRPVVLLRVDHLVVGWQRCLARAPRQVLE